MQTETNTLMLRNKVVPSQYYKALEKFADRLKVQQQEANTDPTVTSIDVETEGGRKYDKITIVTTRKYAKRDVRYFVERETGKIFGAKSPVAPNELRFFGTVYHARKWNWSGFYGVPVSDSSVVEVGGYGDVIHYAEVADEPAKATA